MTKRFLYLSVAMVALFAISSFAQTVNVTFIVNTAAVPDTLKANSVVQIRGSELPLTWDDKTGVTLQNIGGDYWKGTAQFTTGKTVQFKLFTNASNPLGGGWENNLTDASGNRILIVGTKDTTLPLQFVNGSPAVQDQYWKPYKVLPDSISLWLRVDMQG